MRFQALIFLLLLSGGEWACGHSYTATSPSTVATPVAPSPTPEPPASTPLLTLTGTLSEPGGAPIADALVSTSVGKTTLTDANGRYRITELPVILVSFEKAGYEGRGPFGRWLRDLDLSMKMQRSIYIRAGDTLDSVLLPDDVFYETVPNAQWDYSDAICGPCKLLHVLMPGIGRLDIHVSLADPAVTVGIWEAGKPDAHVLGNGELFASIPAESTDMRIYVGTIWRGNDPPFAAAKPFRFRTVSTGQ